MRRAAIEDIYPLSPMQQGMLFHSLLEPGTDVYIRQLSYEIQVRVRPEAFRAAWQAVVDRHPALRTIFVTQGQREPHQVVLKQVTLPFEQLDWSDLAHAEQHRRFAQWLIDDRTRTFPLTKPPLMRLTLVRFAESLWRCVWTYHHLLLDGWSMAHLLREVEALYEANLRGRTLELPPPRPYGDFIGWLAVREPEREEAFWRQQLAGLESPTPLGIDRSAPRDVTGDPSSRFLEVVAELPVPFAERLEQALRRRRLTFSSLVYGLWGLLLGRYAGRDDILVGAVFSGRPSQLAGAEEIVGLMINTLPLRLHLEESRPLGEWLQDVQRRRVRLHEFEHTSLAQIQRWSGLPGGTPLIESLVIFENFPQHLTGQSVAGPGIVDVRTVEATNYPLTLLVDVADGIRLHLAADTSRFDSDAIRRLLGHLCHLYRAADLDRMVAEIELWSPAERHQLMVEWNDSATEFPAAESESVHRRIARQAVDSPHAVALDTGERTLTYAELEACANCLAGKLRRQGAGPGELVAICGEASAELVVALLAVLKTGGAYLPLAPSYPHSRLKWMLEDSSARLLLAEERWLDVVPDPSIGIVPLVGVADPDADRMISVTELQPAVLHPAALAYVIYTSGSTGRPKGVAVSHGALANFLAAMSRRPGLDATACLLTVTPLSFDIAALEIFLPLIVGARLLLTSREVARDGDRLAGEIAARQVTALQATPATWKLLDEARQLRGSTPLLALCGGEALPIPLAAAVRERWGALWNLYGPTETTIWSAVHPFTAAGESRGGWVALGRAIANTRIFCVDARLRPVPVAVPGELVIGGRGLAQGYRGRPVLTAERFVPEAFDAVGGRLYRTGDLACYRRDGTLEYLGRLDHQVKIRGHRIELGEIEAVLGRSPGVRETVVIGREDRPGEVRLAAYYVADPQDPPRIDRLREDLRAQLPDVMVPAFFIPLEALPLTPNGKVDRSALPAPEARASSLRREPRSELERIVAGVWAEVLELEHVGVEDNFFDLGGYSLVLMRVRRMLVEALGREIELLELFRHPTVSSLARFLAGGDAEERLPQGEPASSASERRQARVLQPSGAVAIIGMAGRFPGARNLEELWTNLRTGQEGVHFFTDAELRASGISEELLAHPSYVRAKGLLQGAELFDAEYFGYTPRDAEVIDPQQRVFLEVAVEAFENAGYDPARGVGVVGVFAGSSMNTYWPRLSSRSPAEGFQAMIGNDKDFLATRVSYKLDLKGPSVGVQTACSTSLVAVHMAARSLQVGDCDLALVGGVSILWPRAAGYLYSEGMIISPDGHCRTFDERAQGTVPGEGAGAVVLKRLADALADGDTIHAVILGSAINNDGSLKVSYTAPSVDGQALAISAALASAEVDSATISYVEAHGTATPLGDPIEVAALARAFGDGPRSVPCALGSIKSNIGHLDVAAGIAGLIKTVLALEHGELPPSLHWQRPNPRIDFAGGRFRVNAELSAWPRNGQPRRAGVSSFGIGGTNAHVVVEEAPPEPERPPAPLREHLLLLSAQSETALEQLAGRLSAHLELHPDLAIDDVAWTLERGRRHLQYRRALVCRDLEGATEALAIRSDERPACWAGGHRPVVALFPGQGTQRVMMGAALYHGEPVFRRELDRCAELLRPHLGEDLRALLFPELEADPERQDVSRASSQDADLRLQQTRFAQPALFAVEYSLTLLLRENGVHPEAMLGHSLGEYVAACLAGVFELEDALSLVAERGRLMESLPSGAMLAVSTSAGDLEPFLGEGLSLAAINAPKRTVVSGSQEAIEGLAAKLRDRGVATRLLHTSHAFHSAMMEPILEPFRERIRRLRRRPPRLPFISNLTGDWIRDEEATDPYYWAEHLRRPVRFGEGLRRFAGDQKWLFVEIGPGKSLASLVAQQGGGAAREVVSVLPGGGSHETLADPLARLWLAGVPIARAVSEQRPPRRVPLPTYPFDHQPLVAQSRAASKPGVETFVAPVVAPVATRPLAVAPTPTPSPGQRPSWIAERLFAIVERLAGFRRDQIDLAATFQEVGVDSLLLVQFSEALREELAVEVPMARLMDDLSTLKALIGHLETELSATDPLANAAPAPAPSSPSLSRLPVAPPQTLSAAVPVRHEAFGPYQPNEHGQRKPLGKRAEQGLAELVRRYTARTAVSKRRTDDRRFVFADNRASADFRRQWKEIVYPLIGERSSGARLWDVDGNEYVDLAMGFGVHLFGHSPPFISAALHEQIERGLQLGPQSDLAGEVAQQLSDLTGRARIAFSNTGTEAVMTAVRLARAATGREKIALFAGSYHGSFDGVLMRSQRAESPGEALPVAPGVPRHMAHGVMVLPYGDASALAAIRGAGDQLAAVLVEPVQSRRPGFHPREFLHELRALTAAQGQALIFDEVITGLRVHPGGAAAVFGIEPDLATYGKVLGGGMPIGVIAGRPEFMDAIDGGVWRFGDDSYPRASKTFFAGTFCKHPLAMAAARAVVDRLSNEGPGLQERLNQRTAALAAQLNDVFQTAAVPIRVVCFGSLFRFEIDPRLEFGELFFYYLLLHGVYTWEGRTCFLSTAHSEADLQRIVSAVAASVEEMRAGHLLPGPEVAAAAQSEVAAYEHREVSATHAQQQLWFLAQVDEDASRGYNESQSLSLVGTLDPAALAAAYQRAVDRHEALRATFSPDGRHLIIVARRCAQLPEVDLTALALDNRRRCAAALAAAEARRLFDLVTGPLVRVLWLRLGSRRHQLVITCHHSVLDGQSLSALLQELEVLYRTAHDASALPVLPSRALADLLAREVSAQDDPAALAYWLDQLRGSPPVLELPCDRPRPAVQTFRGGFLTGRLAAGDLRSAAAQRGTTLFGLVLSAYCLLLHRLTGQSEVVVGVPSAAVGEGEGVVLGYALQLLPIRSDIGAETRLQDLLVRLRERVLAGQRHRHFSYTELLKRLGLRPRASRSPLVATVFNLDTARRATKFGDLEMAVTTNPTGGARFELFLNLTDFGDELRAEAEYNADLFDATTLERWLRHYEQALVALAEAPEQRVLDLPLVTGAERWQILCEWNATSAPRDRSRRIHELFEDRAKHQPEAIAVHWEGRQLSYGDLDRRSGRLARQLCALGCRRGDFVAIDLRRSFAMVVALLAVLRAGAAYVPLSASFPPARKRWILERLGVKLLLTDSTWDVDSPQPGETSPDPAQAVRLDRDGIAQEPVSTPVEEIETGGDAGDLAYVIFTSGSTGTPKGVMVRHQPVVNLIEWINQRFCVGVKDRLLFVTSLSFDLSVYDVFGILAAGGSVRIASERELEEPERLVDALCDEPITFWDSAPAALQQLAPLFRQPAAGSGPDLRLVFLSGDWIPVALPDTVRAAFPAAQVIALGGATEATVWSNYHTVGRVALWWASIPYGRPITNARYHVLDAALAPVPIGVAGDLYIGGSCLASGYAAEPRLTAARFLPDPFGSRSQDSSGDRLYRTGDRARYRAAGELEFLGRLDHQVKIRGFRIELGEIEGTFTQHPAVAEVAVLAREDKPGQKRLVAYVVLRNGSTEEASGLLDFLALQVPDYMVPAHVVFLAQLPLTANGKLDRAALPAPGASPLPASACAAPRTREERLLERIWCELLGRERIGIDEHFLEIGGDSVLSIQIVARAARAGLKISHRQIYEQPTIASLAAVAEPIAEQAAAVEEDSGTVELTPIARWFFDLDLCAPYHFNQSLIFTLRRPLVAPLLDAAIARLIEHHGALRQRFARTAEGWQCEVMSADPGGGLGPLVTIDLSRLAELDEPARAAVVEGVGSQIQASLDLGRGPLLRAALLRLGTGAERLLLAVHHLAVDGVSWQILLTDLQEVYAALERGERAALSQTTPLKTWARELARYAASGALQSELPHWLKVLDAPPALPIELEDGFDDVAATRTEHVALDEPTTRALLGDAPAAYRAEAGDLLMAALARTLGDWTGHGTPLIELEGHGRAPWLSEDLDLSRTVGWFTVLYPVRLDLSGAGDPGAEIRAIKEQLRSVPGRGVGFGLLRSSEPRLAARLAGEGAPGILFNYLGQLDRALPAGAPLAPAMESTGQVRSPRQRRSHAFEINCFVLGGRLQIRWSYGAHRHRRRTVERLVRSFAKRLETLVAYCTDPVNGGLTPSDFPLARLDSRSAEDLARTLAAADNAPLGLAVRNVEDVYPLSPLQESLWVHAWTSPSSSAGFEQLALTLRGELDPELFARTWRLILDRHTVLRTAFVGEGLARPLQVVRRRVDLTVASEDWRWLDAAESDARLADWLAEDRRRGFRLERAPLLRLALLRTGDDRWHLVWSHHHLILDGWCRALVLREVLATYQQLAGGEQPTAATGRPFRDYIAWLESRDRETERRFWREGFEGFAGPTPFVVDRLPTLERPAIGRQGSLSRRWPAERVARLRTRSQAFGVTLSTLMQAAWGVLLARYSGRGDVLFGATVSGRPPELAGVEAMVGMFINNLPVRLQVPTGALVEPWLRRLQVQQQELRHHEHTALETIQAASGLPGGRRLFESLVVFQNTPRSTAEEPGTGAGEELGLDLHSYSLETAYPVTLVAEPAAVELSFDLYFEERRLDRSTAERLLGHFEELLGALAGARPRARLAELCLLSAAERREIVGRPARESEVFDSWGWPAPVGVIGELAALAEGRLRPSGRWARRLPSGELEVLGEISILGTREVVAGEIEALLARHPEVLESEVTYSPDEASPEGISSVAWVVPCAGAFLSSAELRAHLRQVLSERALPAIALVEGGLPRGAAGQLDLTALCRAYPAVALKRPHVAPRSMVELELVRLWEELFDLRPIGIRDDFFALGGHSLLAVRLVHTIRDRFGCDLPLAALFEGQTIERLAAKLADATPKSWSPLVEIQAGVAERVPLFLIHPSGGGSLGYVELARQLGPEQPVYGLQARGHASGQEPLHRVEEMAELYVEAIRAKLPQGPYLLGGLSFGGYVAYEMARQLDAAGADVRLVAMLDTGTWSGSRPDPQSYLAVLVGETFGEEFRERFSRLPATCDLDGQLAYILAEARHRELVPDGFELADLRRYFDLYWINVQAAFAYKPEPYPGRVAVFRAADNPEEQLAPEHRSDPTLGWGALAATVEVYSVPGTHFNMHRWPQVEDLAETLGHCLRRLHPAAETSGLCERGTMKVYVRPQPVRARP